MIVHAAYDAPGAYDHRRTRPEDSPTFALFSQAGIYRLLDRSTDLQHAAADEGIKCGVRTNSDNIATAADLPSLAGSGLNKSLASLPVSATWK